MKTDIKKYVLDLFGKLHLIPEKGFEEYKTSRLLADELKACGYEVTENVGGKTGIIGILDSGVPGPTLALRADMDALEYVIDGVTVNRHTCGHDAHSSMVMATAKRAIEDGIKKGKLMIVFQPAEEKLYGAISMIESGLLDDVDEMFGIHIRPVDDTCLGKATPAVWHSASTVFTVKVKGISAHGARPHLGVNAVDIAVSIVNAINAIRVKPSVPHSIKVTNVSVGGDTYNSIPDELFMAMDIRSQDNDVMDDMKTKVETILKGISSAYGGGYEIISSGGVPAAEFDPEMIQVAEEAILDVLGKDGSIGHLYNPGGEDYHHFTRMLKKCKSGYIGLGADATPGLHHKDMTFNTDCLILGVDILSKVVEKRLNK